MEIRKLYTVKEVAEILRVNTDTVYRLIKNKELSAVKIGNIKIRPEDLERYLKTITI